MKTMMPENSPNHKCNQSLILLKVLFVGFFLRFIRKVKIRLHEKSEAGVVLLAIKV